MPFCTTTTHFCTWGKCGCEADSLLDELDQFWGGDGAAAVAAAPEPESPVLPLMPKVTAEQKETLKKLRHARSQMTARTSPEAPLQDDRQFQRSPRRHTAAAEASARDAAAAPPRGPAPESPRRPQRRPRDRSWPSRSHAAASAIAALDGDDPRTAAKKAAEAAVRTMVHPMKKSDRMAEKQEQNRRGRPRSRSRSRGCRDSGARGRPQHGRAAKRTAASPSSSSSSPRRLRVPSSASSTTSSRGSSRSSSSSSTLPRLTPQKLKRAPPPVTNTLSTMEGSGKRDGPGGRRARKSMWDVVQPDTKLQTDQKAVEVYTKKNALICPRRKEREVYCGNLVRGTTEPELHEVFRRLLHRLPAYLCTYGELDPVVSVCIPPQGTGAFAFVEFVDTDVAGTAVLCSGFDLNGRRIRIGRPQGYNQGNGPDPKPLDVMPLREAGVLPSFPEIIVAVQTPADVYQNKLREIYIGNLSKSTATEDAVTELLVTVCAELPCYRPEMGQPITRMKMHPSGAYCFVQLQNAEMAGALIDILDNTDFFGRKIRVSRPAQVKDLNTLDAFNKPPASGLLALPPATTEGGATLKALPPPQMDACAMGAAAGLTAIADMNRL